MENQDFFKDVIPYTSCQVKYEYFTDFAHYPPGYEHREYKILIIYPNNNLSSNKNS